MFGKRRERRVELVDEGTGISESMWALAKTGEWDRAREFYVVLRDVNAEIVELGLRGEPDFGPFHSTLCSFEFSISTRTVAPTAHAEAVGAF